MLRPAISSIKALYVAGVYIVFVASFALISGCSDQAEDDQLVDGVNRQTVYVEELPAYPSKPLPDGLEWQTNDTARVYASPDAKKGGEFREFVLSFPLTLRTVGPDANSSFTVFLRANQLSLMDKHPNTEELLPSLATHWAYDEDGKTVYYKLDPRARWSDGKPVTADDYVFVMDFMRSEHIVSPWHNKQYTEEIVDIKKYDDHTISVTGSKVKPREDLHYYYGLAPLPRHFHKLDKDWVKNYSWRVEPNTGPYQITKIKKGKFVEFTLQKDWWAKDLRLYKNRYNVKEVNVMVIRDVETAYRHFLKGELDTFPLTLPAYWHEKTNSDEYKKGYINRIWFYNNMPQPSPGMYLNADHDALSDINVRLGLHHSMNFDKVINTVLRGDYIRLNSLDTGYGDYTNVDIKAREFDLKKAGEYFDKAGWLTRGSDGIRVKDGQRLSFIVTYLVNFHTDQLVVLKEEAKKAGVELNLELLDPSTGYRKFMEKKHEIAWSAWGAVFRPQYWGQFHSDNAHKSNTVNITATDDPEMDALIERFRSGTDHVERAALARAIQEKIHDLAVVIPRTLAPFTREAYWRWVKFPEVPGTKWSESIFESMGTGLFWIDEEEKERTLAAMKKGEAFEPVTIIDTTYKIQ